MFDILRLLPVHCLLNSARYVCKSWATTIHSSFFVEACLQSARSKPGLYVEHYDSQSSSYFMDIKDDVNGQFEFERIDLGTPPEMGSIVSSCDGILLLRNSDRQHFVTNPILKCWLRIPPLSISKDCKITLVRVPHTTMFKLFFIDIVEVLGTFWHVFYVLRIGIDNSLKEIARKEAPYKPYLLRQPLYIGGNDVYYITMEGITVVDVDKDIIVGEYSLPPVEMMWYDSIPISLWIGDHLSCIVKKRVPGHHHKYEIYILDFDSGKWSLYHEMGPFDFSVACDHESIILVTTFRLWINDQITIQVFIKRKKITRSVHFSYNVKTRQLKKIEDISERLNIRVWLHTNSLV